MKTKEELALELAASNEPIKDIQCPRNCKNPGLYFGFIKGYEAAVKQMEERFIEAYEAASKHGLHEDDKILIDDDLLEELLNEPTHTVIYTTYENFLHNTHREDCTITCEEDRELIVEDIMNEGGFDIQFIKLTWCPND